MSLTIGGPVAARREPGNKASDAADDIRKPRLDIPIGNEEEDSPEESAGIRPAANNVLCERLCGDLECDAGLMTKQTPIATKETEININRRWRDIMV